MSSFSRYAKAEASPGFILYRTANAHNRVVREALMPWKLTQAQFAILAAVHSLREHAQICTQTDVAAQLLLDKMLVSDVVRLLVGRKLLNRRPNPNDARSYTVALTRKAVKVLPLAFAAVEEADQKFFATSPVVVRYHRSKNARQSFP